MWYFLCLAVLKVELLAPEVRSKFKKKIDGNAVFKKKVTATIFENSKNCGRDFFFDTS